MGTNIPVFQDPKPRLVEITDPAEIEHMKAGGLDRPHVYIDLTNGKIRCDADELRAWRAARESQRISEGGR